MATSEEKELPNQFPMGLRVFVIDYDSAVLESIRQMCIDCHYKVVTCSNALDALNHLRDNKDCIDVILIDVHMSDKDGGDAYKFLESNCKEINVPVVVMSVDDDVSARMKSIRHEICDYWRKPVSEEKIRHLWMHVARKVWKETKLGIKFGSFTLEDEDRKKVGKDDSECGIEEAGTGRGVVVVRDQTRSNSKECEVDIEADKYAPPPKKPRVIWGDNLHKLFVKAKFRHQLRSKWDGGMRVKGKENGMMGLEKKGVGETVRMEKEEEEWHGGGGQITYNSYPDMSVSEDMMGRLEQEATTMHESINNNNNNKKKKLESQMEGYSMESAPAVTTANTQLSYDFDCLYQDYPYLMTLGPLLNENLPLPPRLAEDWPR
ncbi:hypothetical protein VNO78_10035 [Psophocarpus tetragonolobus]|uniref:Response regulatory domain-containing protein n=1 Tax=Psophocarpus tetragonolobus TaxID=3891 RepID=A0AAN9XM60_PSOTE